MNDLLTESQKHERDVRLYGIEAANEIARLRKLVEENRRLVKRLAFTPKNMKDLESFLAEKPLTEEQYGR